jgi:hypothetical protein
MKISVFTALICLNASSVAAFTSSRSANAFLKQKEISLDAASSSSNEPTDRRSLLVGGAAAFLAGTTLNPGVGNAAIYPAAKGGYKLGDKNSVVGREIRSFNDLVYNFKNTALNGGLDGSKIKGPSVPFIEFGERMKNGEVSFVEFMAPFGEEAYVTFKPKEGEKTSPEPIRIGQGYPTIGKDSWSSPDYVIRSVSNFGVPYKFTVPMLARYKNM